MLRKLDLAGFKVIRISYANTILFPAIAAKRITEQLLPYKQANSDLALSTGRLDSVFRAILSLESKFMKSSGLPFGLTVIALAEKMKI